MIKLEESVNALRERVARVEGIVEQMDKRLNHIETELRGLREEFATFRKEVGERFEGLRKEIFGEISSLRREVFGEISSLRRELNTRFYWLIGILMTMWVTIILAILFRAR